MNHRIQDKTNIEWRRVKDFCETKLAELRQENDADLNELETAKLRGKIEFAKMVLSLEGPDFKPEINDTSYID